MKLSHARYGPAHYKIILSRKFFCPGFFSLYIRKLQAVSYFPHYRYFFSYGINQVKLDVWEENSKWNPRESTPGAHVKDPGIVWKTGNLRNSQRVKDML